MKTSIDLIIAERIGSQVAGRFGLSAFPISPHLVADKRGITVAAKPLTGCSGCLMRHGDQFGIIYSSTLASTGRVNFTIAHELGHYFLEGHAEILFPNGDGLHQSASPFRSTDPHEREADHFAVGLLLPEDLFVKALRAVPIGIEGIQKLAEQCGTSLTATAIRYATLADDPVALIVATGSHVHFCFMSAPLRDYKGIQWPRKGSIIPRGTVTAQLAAQTAAIERAEMLTGTTSFADWIEGAPESECNEDVVGLGRFGQTLTLLWSDCLEDDEDEESYDDVE